MDAAVDDVRDLAEVVEDDGAVCEVCGELLLRGQEVRWVGGCRGHVEDWVEQDDGQRRELGDHPAGWVGSGCAVPLPRSCGILRG
jgi:hypothetical protein